MDRDLKVLVVDDMPINNTLLQAALKQKHCQVLDATSGEQALQIAETEHPDLAILDVLMPNMDGNELLQRLRQSPATKDMKIYMLSAVTAKNKIEHTMELGADGYIKKPIIIADLFKIVEDLRQSLS